MEFINDGYGKFILGCDLVKAPISNTEPPRTIIFFSRAILEMNMDFGLVVLVRKSAYQPPVFRSHFSKNVGICMVSRMVHLLASKESYGHGSSGEVIHGAYGRPLNETLKLFATLD